MHIVLVPLYAKPGRDFNVQHLSKVSYLFPQSFESFLNFRLSSTTMSAKSPWNTLAVVGVFYPRPFFAAKMTVVSPLPPLYNVESIAEALSYLERHHFSLQCYLYHLQTTLFYGGGDFVVRLQHKSQEVFQDFGRHCSLPISGFL